MAVETNNLLLGMGELFIKRDTDAASQYMHIGNLKGNVTFTYEIETTEQKPGNKLTAFRRDKIGEKATLKASVCDIKIPQLISALGLSITASAVTQTTTLRVWKEIAFGSTTDTTSLGDTPVSLTNVVVTSLDRATKFVRGTDYTMYASGKIKAKLAGFANRSNFCHYDYADASATRLRVGDDIKLQKVDLKFTHKLANGKHVTLEIPIATVMGGLTIPFNETEYTAYDVTFQALGDMTKAAGQSLFKIIREA